MRHDWQSFTAPDLVTSTVHNPRTLAATSDPHTHDPTAATPAGGPHPHPTSANHLGACRRSRLPIQSYLTAAQTQQTRVGDSLKAARLIYTPSRLGRARASFPRGLCDCRAIPSPRRSSSPTPRRPQLPSTNSGRRPSRPPAGGLPAPGPTRSHKSAVLTWPLKWPGHCEAKARY
jgi:hypothetical protein